MTITNFSISNDRTQFDLTITDAASATSLKLWTVSTYKDYSLAIDLTSKLTGSATEVITISLADISQYYFDGVYFIEVEDVNEIVDSITSDLTRYKECILNKILNVINADGCLAENSAPFVNVQTLLYGLNTAIENSFIDEIIKIVNSLEKYCSNECISCSKYKNIVNNTYYNS